VASKGRGAQATRTTTTAVPAAGSATPARPDSADEPGSLFLVASYAVLLLLGVVLAVLGVFLASAGPRVGGHLVLPIGLVIALVGHPIAGVLGLVLTGTRAGTLTPLAGWAAVVLPLSSGTAQGDIVLPGNLLSIGYLLLGAAAYGVVAVFTRPTRGRAAFPPR
jgi:hypothetical protein